MVGSLGLWRTLQLVTVTLHGQEILEMVSVAMKVVTAGSQVVKLVLHGLIWY